MLQHGWTLAYNCWTQANFYLNSINLIYSKQNKNKMQQFYIVRHDKGCGIKTTMRIFVHYLSKKHILYQFKLLCHVFLSPYNYRKAPPAIKIHYKVLISEISYNLTL